MKACIRTLCLLVFFYLAGSSIQAEQSSGRNQIEYNSPDIDITVWQEKRPESAKDILITTEHPLA